MAIAILAASLAVLTTVLPSARSPGDPSSEKRAYPLTEWQGRCGAKGRLQDREYCRSSVMDLVVADGARAIPVLISQITDERVIRAAVLDYWPRIRTGELAVLILEDLFVDETWERRTMPDLFADRRCDSEVPASACWAHFREKHSLSEIQTRWSEFWKTNESRIHWDGKARCFRMADEGR